MIFHSLTGERWRSVAQPTFQSHDSQDWGMEAQQALFQHLRLNFQQLTISHQTSYGSKPAATNSTNLDELR